MAEFLTTNGISYHIENIIKSAKKFVILVSPYLKFSKNFYERLLDANRKGVRLIIIYGKDELNNEQRTLLEDINSLELFFSENLHAKCYLNESSMIITSMNMYEFSEKNNREMGIMIYKISEPEIYKEVINEIDSIRNSAKKEEFLNKSCREKKSSYRKKNEPDHGYCIRCKEEITYDSVRPYCENCYDIWNYYQNYEYEENYCHKCGTVYETTKIRPFCYSCYSEVRLNGFMTSYF